METSYFALSQHYVSKGRGNGVNSHLNSKVQTFTPKRLGVSMVVEGGIWAYFPFRRYCGRVLISSQVECAKKKTKVCRNR
jgi:hypothetical protein